MIHTKNLRGRSTLQYTPKKSSRELNQGNNNPSDVAQRQMMVEEINPKMRLPRRHGLEIPLTRLRLGARTQHRVNLVLSRWRLAAEDSVTNGLQRWYFASSDAWSRLIPRCGRAGFGLSAGLGQSPPAGLAPSLALPPHSLHFV
ncbi:hypothetical protein HBH56_057900 [Parastagonospora nodorum]|nr:hypothetical protein HBH56_057900 [Parastagonospora nodorum]KAH3931019.1 hypothetical protein HBH54_101830 [Parastagonospora nodorum]KAH4140838.1 hypothetical protein HBH45_079960 [Parastagonospora nodorum]KAH4168023.1 hypothetical protein HBH44_055820 [Parastagonospora nodorum]KAH4199493.1 hypothetical protein HBI95_174090 [Parastagonospora nodorum]